MRYALNLPAFGAFADARALASLAREAEDVGWDGFFIWDHIQSESGMSVADPWVTLTAIAMKTERIHIGALVTPLPRRRPWKFARETATLDHLSQGRLIVGVGIGSDQWYREYSTFGEPLDDKTHAAMLDEGSSTTRPITTHPHLGRGNLAKQSSDAPCCPLGWGLPNRRRASGSAGRSPRHAHLYPATPPYR